MPHAIGKQIVHRPPQQEGISLYLRPRRVGKIHLKIKAGTHTPVKEICCDLPQKGRGLDGFFSQCLHLTVQTHGEVQIIHQIPDRLTLGVNGRSLPLVFLCQVWRFFQLSGIAGSFLGILSMLFPPALIRCVPWGYYGLLSLVGMDWNVTTRVTQFYWRLPPVTDVVLLFLWMAEFLIVGRILFVRKEV